jgi:hypothetical protein
MSTPLSKLEALAGLIRNDGADAKPTLLRVLTDFYVQKRVHSPEENAHFTELALRLIDEVDDNTRKDIARRLAEHGSAPEIILQRLTGARGSQEGGAADLPAPPPARAHGSDPAPAGDTADANTDRREISLDDRAAATGFSERFFAADSQTRRAMLRELDVGAAVAPLGVAAAEAMATCRVLEAAALRSRPYEFVCEMERALAIPRTIAQAIVNDASGEPMLIVAKALGMPTDVVQRILLLVNPAVGNSVRRVFELSDLYENLSARAVLRLISLWRYSERAPAHDDPAGNPARETGAARRSFSDSLRRPPLDVSPDRKKQDQRAS